MTAFLLIPLYALADRFAGGGWPALDARLPGRAAFWAALACAGIGFLLLGRFGALCALAWFIWRTPGWKVFGGSMAPRGAGEIVGLALRHLIATPCIVLAAYWSGGDLLFAAAAGVAFACVATALGVYLGSEVAQAGREGVPLGNQNTVVELARGAAFGAAIGLSWFAST